MCYERVDADFCRLDKRLCSSISVHGRWDGADSYDGRVNGAALSDFDVEYDQRDS